MNMVLKQTLPLALLSVLGACGKAKPMPEFDMPQMITYPADGSNIEGLYMVDFITLNTNANGFLTTSASIIKKGDKFQVSLKLSDGAPNVWHKQDIYLGWRCPTEEDDLNKDGYIDIKEGNLVWDKPIIPLDSDLNSQEAGKNKYPVSGSTGAYNYKRTVEFDKMFKDLKQAPVPDSEFAKLGEEVGLGLEGNVLIILGTDERINLPETVATIEGLDRHKTFPVACGLIKKVEGAPGTTEFEAEENIGNLETPSTRPIPASESTEVRPPPISRPETRRPSPPPRPDSADNDEEWDDRLRNWWRDRWREISGS